MVITDTVLDIVSRKGPVIPVNISKEIGQNILMTGAVLSELTSRGKIKTSSLKVGGSPLYYVPGQEEKLLNYINYLDKNEQRSAERLQKEGVIRESAGDALTRYTLKVIKDFAIPLTVRVDGATETFYKWFMLSDEDAEQRIRNILLGGISTPRQEHIPNVRDQDAAIKNEPISEKPAVQIPSTPKTGGPFESESKTAAEPTAAAIAPVKTDESNLAVTDAPIKPARKPRAKTEKAVEKKEVVDNIEPEIASDKPESETSSTSFSDTLAEFFRREGIAIEKETIIKKNMDYEYVLNVPSPVGSVSFYAYAKNKKKITESDLATLLVKAQYHKLPGLLLTSGEATKKALEMLPKELKGITIKQI